ncbi:MAG: GNAT family N-acetyltransferase [Defluviitaleaceae bacterium]|nr:GNAT family N-acetyltransferase [Defluviitaleaceae bacterium]
MNIRQITEPDIPTLSTFEKEISEISFGDEAVTDLDFHARKIRKSLGKDPSGMFVMTESGGASGREEKIIGWLWMDGKENFLTGENYVNFRSFYIVKEYQGGEAAKALLERGMAYCRETGAKAVVGKVHVSNLPMRALYKSFGFEATHITMEYRFERK